MAKVVCCDYGLVKLDKIPCMGINSKQAYKGYYVFIKGTNVKIKV